MHFYWLSVVRFHPIGCQVTALTVNVCNNHELCSSPNYCKSGKWQHLFLNSQFFLFCWACSKLWWSTHVGTIWFDVVKWNKAIMCFGCYSFFFFYTLAEICHTCSSMGRNYKCSPSSLGCLKSLTIIISYHIKSLVINNCGLKIHLCFLWQI